MKAHCLWSGAILSVFSFSLFSGAAISQSQGSFSQPLGRGEVNWTEQYIEVVGSGVAPSSGSSGQQKLMARRAATADAYRNLLELVEGVQVSAETTVRDFVTKSDVVRLQVQGVIKGATPVGPPRQSSDGAVEITLRMPLYGKLATAVGLGKVVQDQQAMARQMSYRSVPMLASGSLEGFSWSEFQVARCERFGPQEQTISSEASPEPIAETDSESDATSNGDAPEPVYEPQPTPAPTARPIGSGPSLQANHPDQPFTGLIVDASGLNLTPSMSPVVKASTQQVYIGDFELDIDRVITEGIVLYFSSMEAAQANPRVGEHPLIVRAIGTDLHRVDFYLDPEDARQIAVFDQRDQFLKNLNVVAVL